MKVSIWQARRSWSHRPGRLSFALGVLLALGWLASVSAAPLVLQQTAQPLEAAMLQQDTMTPSPTASLYPTASPSPIPSPSATPTLTTTAATMTVTPTGSPAASLTATLTSTPAASATLAPPSAASPTWTPPYPSPIPPSAAVPGVLASPTESGPTATLVPLPTVTFQFPGVTPGGDLMALVQPTAAQVLPKGQNPFALGFGFGRGWFLWLVVVLWSALVAWFVFAQIIARRQ